jgi:glucosamine--fructose-6-phosphate aminotransferase (isomerizing)
MLVLYLLILKISKERNDIDFDEYKKMILDLKKLPDFIKETLSKQNDIQVIAKDFITAKGTMYLGRGFSYPIAMEGALKLKELSYIHAEGYAAGEMKHGPLALIEDGMPVIVLAPKDRYYEKTISNMQEVIARGGKVIMITDDASTTMNENIRFKFQIPKTNSTLNSFLLTIPIQFLAYHVALLKNCDIDKPRNLAKSVTVE